MFPVLSLGPISIPVPEFALLLGFWAGVYLAESKSRTSFEPNSFIEGLLWTSLLAGVLGGRLAYFARHPGAFQGDYLSLLALNPNLFDLPAGLLVAGAYGSYLISRKNLSFLQVLDHLAPFFSVLAAAVHFSRFASGSGFGLPTALPWGLQLWGVSRHPVQLYNLSASLLVLLIVLRLLKKNAYAQGYIFFTYLLLASCYLLLFAGFQEPGLLLPGGLRPAQVLFWLLILISLIFLNRLTPTSAQESNHAAQG